VVDGGAVGPLRCLGMPLPPAPWAGRLIAGLALVILAAGAPPAAAEPDDVRPYLGLRLGLQLFTDRDVVPGVRASRPLDAYGVALGADLGRWLSVEVAADHFEPVLRDAEGSLGELGILTVIPQLRLRYPLLDGRLAPYLLSGVGVGLSEFNDRKPRGFGRSISAGDVGLAWSAGAGIEYLIAPDVAVGGEVRYLSLSGHDIVLDGERHRAGLDSIVAVGTLRAYLGGRPSQPPSPAARSWAPYLAFHGGAAHLLRPRIAPGIEARPENAAIGSEASQVYGVAVGVELAPWIAIELAADGSEFNLRIPDLGTVAEYAFYAGLVQARLSWPLLDGRLRPSLLAGLGVGYAEANDRKPRAADLELSRQDWGVAGALGVGVEYRVLPSVGFVLATRYLLARGHHLQVGDREGPVRLDALVTTAGVRILFR
jgi:opacity protein-like surface antigen